MLNTKTYSGKIYDQEIQTYRIDPNNQKPIEDTRTFINYRLIPEIRIESNIFSPVLEASITIVDSSNKFVPKLKTDGCSVIQISLKETGLFNKLKQLVNLPNGVNFSHSFLVSDIQMKNYQGGVYTINLISLQSIFLLSKISFSSRGEKTWLEILNSLLAQSTLNYQKDLLLNSDQNKKQHFISPCNWNLGDCINYCLARIIDDGLGLGFLRYRMYNNKYDLIFLKSYIPFTEDEKTANNFILRNNRKDSEGTQYILDIYETNPLGYEDSCDIFTPVKVLTYDYERRKYNKKQYDEYDLNELGFPKIQNMESFTNFNMFKNGKQWIYNNSKTVYENRYPLYNTLSRGLLMTNTLVVTTYGNIIRCAGQTMNISTDATINDLNQRYDGDFLITSVVHVFKASDYFTHIQCARMKQKPAEYGFIHNTLNKVKKFINKNLGI